MDDDGEFGGVGEFHLLAEDGVLDVAGGVVVEIVEADFAPGDYFGMFREAGEFVEMCGVTSLASWGWMPTVV